MCDMTVTIGGGGRMGLETQTWTDLSMIRIPHRHAPQSQKARKAERQKARKPESLQSNGQLMER